MEEHTVQEIVQTGKNMEHIFHLNALDKHTMILPWVKYCIGAEMAGRTLSAIA